MAITDTDAVQGDLYGKIQTRFSKKALHTAGRCSGPRSLALLME